MDRSDPLEPRGKGGRTKRRRLGRDAARSFIPPFTPVAKATCLQGSGAMHNHGQNNRQGGTEREGTINTGRRRGEEEEEEKEAADQRPHWRREACDLQGPVSEV